MQQILNIIYPPKCVICGKLNKNLLCVKCTKKLREELKFNIDYYIKDDTKYYNEHISFFKYQKLIRTLLIKLKFEEKPYIHKAISNFLINNEKKLENLKYYDIILIAPISKKRHKERGYNQSEIIAMEIANKLEMEISSKYLVKNKNIKPQSTLNREKRQQNVIGAYQAKNIVDIKEKNILIFDDIYTTGSTANECAKALVQQGILKKQIGIVTIAKD